MSNESDLIAFLHEIMEERIKVLSEEANQQPEFIKINQSLNDFMGTITDDNIRAVLLQYEALKNDYVALIMTFLYQSGAKDSLQLYGLLSKQILSSSQT